LVTLPDPNNVKTITCNIPVDRILYTFEMVEVKFQYKKGKENVTVTGYVAQENLKIPDDTGREIFRIQFWKIWQLNGDLEIADLTPCQGLFVYLTVLTICFWYFLSSLNLDFKF